MRKWTVGLLALVGSALVAMPSAMAQSEFGSNDQTWIWNDEYDPNYYYVPPSATVVPMAPPAAVAPAPGVSYFSPPGMAAGAGAPAAMVIGPGPGQCGTFRYWSASEGQCVDARNR